MIFLGATLSLFIGIFWFITWSQDLTITIDNCFNKAILCKKNLFKKSSIQDICLSDIKAVQLLSYTIKAGQSGWQDTDFDATLYEVNLVVNSPTNQRQFLYSHRKIHVARDAAEKIAIHLETTLLDHSDQKDIRE
jgi:glutamate/tyrosine decarboxylase-like PLP-dependent enzyme